LPAPGRQPAPARAFSRPVTPFFTLSLFPPPCFRMSSETGLMSITGSYLPCVVPAPSHSALSRRARSQQSPPPQRLRPESLLQGHYIMCRHIVPLLSSKKYFRFSESSWFLLCFSHPHPMVLEERPRPRGRVDGWRVVCDYLCRRGRLKFCSLTSHFSFNPLLTLGDLVPKALVSRESVRVPPLAQGKPFLLRLPFMFVPFFSQPHAPPPPR